MPILKSLSLFLLWALPSCLPAQKVNNPLFNTVVSGLLKEEKSAIDVDQAVQMPFALFLDARDSAEFAVSHLRGAMRIGYRDFMPQIMNKIPFDMPIIVYCSVGARSEEITLKLQKMGYSEAKNLYGGIFEWINRGNAVYNHIDQPVKRVHTYNKSWGVWVDCPEKVH
jgi:rhodanese-related sulfurtransferase